MALLLKNGAVFLHIPKTGGNWATRVLEEEGLVRCEIGHKHAYFDKVYSRSFRKARERTRHLFRRLLYRPLSSDPFVFCFVRHPLAWYESWFKYMSQPSRNWRDWGRERDCRVWHPNAGLDGLGSEDFNQFVRQVTAKRPGYVTELYGWYCDERTQFIGKQESLEDDLVRLLQEMNVSFDEDRIRSLGKVGESPKAKAKVEWDSELRAEVLRQEYAGLVRYGYLERE